jgi:hypothetical protein
MVGGDLAFRLDGDRGAVVTVKRIAIVHGRWTLSEDEVRRHAAVRSIRAGGAGQRVGCGCRALLIVLEEVQMMKPKAIFNFGA